MTRPTINDASQDDSRYRNVPSVTCGFARGGDVLKQYFPDVAVSKQKLRRADAIACVRMKRQEANQNLGFASRPLCCADCPLSVRNRDRSSTSDATAIFCFK